MHPSMLAHRGVDVSRGHRYVLVAFVSVGTDATFDFFGGYDGCWSERHEPRASGLVPCGEAVVTGERPTAV